MGKTVISGVTPDQFKEIMNKVKKDHRLIKGRCVKYVETSFDFRDCTFWRFRFRIWSLEKIFTTANRGNDEGLLFDEIMEWLDQTKLKGDQS